MATGNCPTSPGNGASSTQRDLFLAEVAEHVRRAHELAAQLLEGRIPRPIERNLVRIALELRQTLALLEAEARGRRERYVPMRDMDLRGFAEHVLRDQSAPFQLRLSADQVLRRRPGSVATPARVLCEITEYIAAQQEVLKVDAKTATKAAVEIDEWRHLRPRRLLLAYHLHARAVQALGVRA